MSYDCYPSEEELKRIETWEFQSQADIDALWAFVRKLWWMDCFGPAVRNEGRQFPYAANIDDADWYVCTLGWSGNESLIDALQHNIVFWSLCWRASVHGGGYWFRIEGRF
jgi:hypothetical protein